MSKRPFRFTHIEIIGFDRDGRVITRETTMTGDEYVKWMMDAYRNSMAMEKADARDNDRT